MYRYIANEDVLLLPLCQILCKLHLQHVKIVLVTTAFSAGIRRTEALVASLDKSE